MVREKIGRRDEAQAEPTSQGQTDTGTDEPYPGARVDALSFAWFVLLLMFAAFVIAPTTGGERAAMLMVWVAILLGFGLGLSRRLRERYGAKAMLVRGGVWVAVGMGLQLIVPGLFN